MLAIHDPFTQQMSDRLQTTCMGLGLVRLLQDARCFEEAKTTLYWLETGCQAKSAPADRKPAEMNRRARIGRPSVSARIDAA